MDRPFFYPAPWSYYCPLPSSRRPSRAPAWSFPPPSDLIHNRNHNRVLSPPRRTPSRTDSTASTAASRRPSRQPSIAPSPRPATRSMMPAPAFSNPFANFSPNHHISRCPSPSFSRCASDLYTTVDSALTYISELHTSFLTETTPIRRYADPNVLDSVWHAKILSGPSPDPNNNNNANNANNDNNDNQPPMSPHERKSRHFTAFADHQTSIRARLTSILSAQPAPHRRHLEDGTPSPLATETAALVTKLARIEQDLLPSLGAMGERYAAVGTAIKELRVLKGNLDTYREVWSEDGNQEGEGQDGYGEGGGRRR